MSFIALSQSRFGRSPANTPAINFHASPTMSRTFKVMSPMMGLTGSELRFRGQWRKKLLRRLNSILIQPFSDGLRQLGGLKGFGQKIDAVFQQQILAGDSSE